MRKVAGKVHQEMGKLWPNSKSLTGVAVLMLAVFVATLFGLILDSRIVTGAPVWLKPAKFAISSAMYAGTLAWVFGHLQVWPGLVRLLGRVTAAVLVIEVAIIDFQAARGTTSHFNVATPFDNTLWTVMGIAIGILWLASIGILVALFRQRFTDTSLGWALRLGMMITVAGSTSGGLMVGPTEQQRLTIAQTHAAPASVGAHTVGAPDGGPGLPGMGWSTNHGDLRVPHFLGLHALQVIPGLYLLRTRRRRRSFGLPTAPYVFLVSASYFALFGILMWQALRGQSIVEPDAATEITLVTWLTLTALGLLMTRTTKLKRPHASTVEAV